MSIALHLEAYGKAVIVKGDTRPLKDFLKSKGGKWFPAGGGWMFQGSKKAAIMQDLQSHAMVSSVTDRTSGAGAVSSSADAAPSATASGKKRAASPVEADESPPSKTAKTSTGDDEFCLDLGSSKRVQVSSFAGRVGVDIRQFFTKDGKELPGKGIRLSEEEWAAVKENVDQIDARASKGAEGGVELVDLFFVETKDGRVDLRKYWLDKADGEKKPTKKGVQLTGEQWASLKQSFADVDTALQKGAPSETAGAKPKKQKEATPAKQKKEKKEDTPNKEKKDKSHAKMERAVERLLEGKDLEQVTFGPFRKELEHELGLEAGALDERKGEIKDLVTKAIKSKMGAASQE